MRKNYKNKGFKVQFGKWSQKEKDGCQNYRKWTLYPSEEFQ